MLNERKQTKGQFPQMICLEIVKTMFCIVKHCNEKDKLDSKQTKNFVLLQQLINQSGLFVLELLANDSITETHIYQYFFNIYNY